ncbi:MAG: hypothetical protein HQL56_14390 [Magnetococcales bacterium]|nr:hypothetical protein [Magnetococcales bacterium]
MSTPVSETAVVSKTTHSESVPLPVWKRAWILARILGGKIRRYFKTRNLNPEELDAFAARRSGNCQMCGACCKLLFECPMLDEANMCRIYTSPVRPRACQAFPMNDADLEDVRLAAGLQCGFAFSKAPVYNTRDLNGRRVVKILAPAENSSQGG